ncbi:type VI secretion system protein TssL, short form [Pseudomonas huaxiensis]|uniref:type VI secretion system protein TssL, short form n=1 Tax=Pseudomonas huaxiensis TaxID=2213017 RepID=UPI000DA6A345|nr:type VI secretion system protein TssL, short form [Pseudomonas huaxiensis]
MNKSNTTTPTVVNVDALLQDSYLLVVELRQGGFTQNGQALGQLCETQIEHVREGLKAAGLDQRSIDYISHAQCALLDETVLSCAQGDIHAGWASEPLQAKFFSRHQAGEFLYEDMRAVLREPAPDLSVLTVFQRVLMLGFKGRYRDVDDPEREHLLAALNALVPPLGIGHSLATQVVGGRRWSALAGLRSSLLHVVAAVLLVVGVWWGLDHMLDDAVATLLPGQA